MRISILLSGLAALAVTYGAGAASVSPAELAQCAGITASDSRLACFDALARRITDGAAPAAVALPAPSAPVAKSAASPPPPTAAAVATPAPVVNDPANFGLSLSQIQKTDSKAPAGPKSVTAHINGLSTGLTGHARIVLDNNQTWDVLDDDGLLGVGNEVTIRKASLGSFLMYAPSHHTYRVHRVN